MKALHWFILGLTLILSAGFAAPVSARPAFTHCTGLLANLTFGGNLVVPEGTYCELDNVVVQGDVFVRQRSTFTAYESRIEGTLNASRFELVLLQDTRIDKQVRLTNGVSTWFERAVIDGDTRLNDIYDMRVLHTEVAGDLVVRGAREQVQFCGSTVAGNAWFARNEGWVLLGGDLATCAANEVQSDMYVHHNQQEITVANNTVGRNLICTANDPAPSVYANVVGGTARGQCSSGAPAEAGESGDNGDA